MRQVGVWMAIVWMAVLASFVVRVPVVAAAPPADVLAYAAFGIERVSIGSRSRVTGDVGCLFDELSLGQGTRVTGAVAGPTVRVRKHVRVSGGYFCSALEGSGDTCLPLPNPLIAGPTIVLAQPGVLDVSTAARAKADAPLAAGAYGALSLGTASQVTLAGGSYQFESIDVKSRAKLLCLAACDVTVRTAVTVGQAARLGIADGVVGGAIVRVAGQAVSTAFDAESRATVLATVYAPSADVKLGAAARLTGGLVGNRVTIGPRARAGPDRRLTMRIGAVELGGRPCIVAAGGEAEVEALAAADGADVVELRADLFDDPTVARVGAALTRLRSGGRPIVLTARAAGEGGRAMPDARRRAIYEAGLELVDAIDVEIASTDLVSALVPAARRVGRTILLSTHDFEATPARTTLLARVERAFEAGADVAKVATHAPSLPDLQVLLDVTRGVAPRPIATLAMGPMGPLSRFVLAAAGSLLTYASVGTPTAPGQMPLAELSTLVRRLFPS